MTVTRGAPVDRTRLDAAVLEVVDSPADALSGVDFVAHWLVNEVGIGGTFEMADLRAARADAQIDRRMRDLRPMGWSIPSNKDAHGLASGMYRLDVVGTLVKPANVSGRVRREVFERDHHRCLICGVAANESYPDDPNHVARLQIGHIVPKGQGGLLTDKSNLRTECERCNAAVRDNQLEQVSAASVVTQVQNLKRSEKANLLKWIRAGRRELEVDEQAYYRWRRLSPEARDGIEDYLAKYFGE